MRAPLLIAAAQPACTAKDVRANALEHARIIGAAGARLVVFPELSLTGYELDADAVSHGDEELGAIVAACAETDSVALVGAPVRGDDGEAHIGMLRVSSGGVEISYRKSYPGGDEPARLAPGDGPVAIDVDSWRVGLRIWAPDGTPLARAGVEPGDFTRAELT